MATNRKISGGLEQDRISPPFRGGGVRAIDKGIAKAVRILWDNGVETIESCEGGKGHPFPEPTVRFAGGQAEGFRALSVALQHGLKVTELRRYYTILDGEPNGPWWELIFQKSTGAGG
jgi:hypothetical protein